MTRRVLIAVAAAVTAVTAALAPAAVAGPNMCC